MGAESFLNDRVTLHSGDCLDVLATLPENSVDSVVCDPPYHLTSIVKRFGKANAESEDYALNKAKSAYMSKGFMGKQWDGGDIAFDPDTWRAVMRVLKPGGHLVAFSGTRTYHRMACAIEDAGFEIRDQLAWCYGSGFPKSHDVSKGIDKAAGAEREVVGVAGKSGSAWSCMAGDFAGGEYMSTAPATDSAREWQGWGTALKPAWEPIVLARKPLSESTVAANVLKWGTGAINVDGSRIPSNGESFDRPVAFGPDLHDGWSRPWQKDPAALAAFEERKQGAIAKAENLGRWPANLCHDGSEEVLAGFPETTGGALNSGHKQGAGSWGAIGGDTISRDYGNDSGSAARFFYTAKADAVDRVGSRHPTVKPVDLIQWLVRLVTPRGGTTLDCFAGTGTTGEAAFREGCKAILIEREAEYQADIRRRMALCLAGPEEKKRAITKAKNLTEENAGPLFS